jgi:hypothetical protein
MERDPFYLQIVERLNNTLDENLFQTCVGDLLGAFYPGLVPYKGGDDAGMDGAVPDGEGEPFPLIVTTGEDAIGNLTRNLNSYLSDNRRRRKAVFATSRSLTPRRIQNLYTRAEELGFVLINVHKQDDIARLLYRHPEWCQDLLGLTGRPAPLSLIPLSRRPLVDQQLTGRENDFNWLKETKGDRLIVGQPGSGKTFLLYQFAKEGQGFFVISEDLGEIANGIRTHRPNAIIIDDAHVKQDLLVRLIHLRIELGAEFSVIASCWPSDKDRIAESLTLPLSNVRSLDQLTRDEIVKVINEAGLGGPIHLVRELVDQAEGRPGLAVTLTRFCLFGDVPRVFSGEALLQFLSQIFPVEAANRLKLVLAAFGMGGEGGMPVNIVADYLGLRPFEIFEQLSTIAPAGVIQENDRQDISVRPQAFRHALVNSVFFQNSLRGMPSISLLINKTPNISETARTLVGVKARGGNIPLDVLIEVLEKAGSEKAWLDFVWLGRDETRWFLANHPEKFDLIVNPGLEYDPQISIPLLLSRAVGDTRPLHSNPDQPLRVLEDWIKAGFEPSGESFRRREYLLEAIRKWVEMREDLTVAVQAVRFVMSPKVEWHETDPGLGNRVSLFTGYLAEKDLISIQSIWPYVLDLLSNVDVPVWQYISDIFWDWANPVLTDHEVLPQSDNMKRFAAKILVDLVPLIQKHPGFVQKAIEMAQDVNVELPVKPNFEFETLYPPEDLFLNEDHEKIRQAQMLKIELLRNEWTGKNAKEVAHQLLYLESEAELVGIHWPRYGPYLCEIFAERVNSPKEWGLAFIEAGLTYGLIEPFIVKAATIEEQGWQNLVVQCLEYPAYVPAALNVILKHPNPDKDLLSRIEILPSSYSKIIETMCLRNEMPLPTILHLLRSGNIGFARSAAYGEWIADPKRHIRPELYEDWEKVIITDESDNYWLRDIFKSNQDVAFKWIGRLLSNQPKHLFRYDNLISAVSEGLSDEQKQKVINMIKPDYLGAMIVQSFTRDSVELYDHLLNIQNMKKIHLYPLGFETRNKWLEKAIVALNHGYTPEDVAGAVYGIGTRGVSWIGSRSGKEKEYFNFFEGLLTHIDERMQLVGKIGKSIAERRLQEALKEERKEAIYGIGYR